MARFNLDPPSKLSQGCKFDDLTEWALREAESVADSAQRECISTVCKSLNSFVQWPARAVLLWNGCDRIAPAGERQRIHSFPVSIKQAAKLVKRRWILARMVRPLLRSWSPADCGQGPTAARIHGACITFIPANFLTSASLRPSMPQKAASTSRKAQALLPCIQLQMG